MIYEKGKGGIQKNSTKNNGAGVSTKSQISENLHQKIVSESVDNVFGFNPKGWSFRKKVPLAYLTKTQHGWGVQQNGKSTVVESDGYFLFYNNKLVGVTEHKQQGDAGNACERFHKYLAYASIWDLEPWQIFGSFTGDGFYKPILNVTGGGQTGATIETLLAYGATVVTNPDEKELENSVVMYLERLQKKYES